MSVRRNLLLFFDRPQEPCFMPKGNRRAVFQLPQNFLDDRYQNIQPQIENRFGDEAKEVIMLKQIKEPNLKSILKLKRNENFSLFIPKHQEIAGELVQIYMDAEDVDELQSVAAFTRDKVNPYLFAYAFSVALLHRRDTRGLNPPNFAQIFPDKFFENTVFVRAAEENSVVPPEARTPIDIPIDYTASDLEDEHKLFYFREDIGLNIHHWHWHLIYPNFGPTNIVNKDRRGELFYFMHSQIISRYNFERLCNKMGRVKKFSELRHPIKEAYFPKLDSTVASRSFPARVGDQVLNNLNRQDDEIETDLDTLLRWKDRIHNAIDLGYAINNRGQQIPLTENEGIDILGNMIEASVLSPYLSYYGNYHGMGHVFISLIHDPDQRHLESFGVMADTATAMRDPIFYRWHGHLEDIFRSFKSTLPRYTIQQLDYPGITISSIFIQGERTPQNQFNTFWQQSNVDLSRGMDFQPTGSIFIRIRQLQHQPFTYTITVNNATGSSKMGTCRIFLAPKFDERGNPWNIREQRHMFIELDKFQITLRNGMNTINRKSTDSTVTIPFERSFIDLDTNRPIGGDELDQFNYCNCGWPHNLLIPKGSPEGFPCELFVMISNYDDDKIDGQDESGVCSDAPIFCGLKGKKYPDRRSMFYPFDRIPRRGVDTLRQFLTPNMAIQDCTIRFSDRIVMKNRPKL